MKAVTKSILWDITSKCNLSCNHCYNAGSYSNDLVDKEFSFQKKYLEVIERLATIGIDHIHLLGGEPLLVNIFNVLTYARKKSIAVSINTNGTLLDQKMIEKLMALKVSQFVVSLDGANSESNDKVRGAGTFDKITNNIKLFNDKTKLLTQIATVITFDNVETIHLLPRLLHLLKLKNLSVSKLYESGNAASNYGKLSVDAKQYVKAIIKLLIEGVRNEVFVSFDCKPKALSLISERYGIPVKLDSVFNKCGAVNYFLYMNCYGDIYPCNPYARYLRNQSSCYKVNILDDNYIDKIGEFANFTHQNFLERSKLNEFCKSCEYFETCNSCTICNNDYSKICETVYFLCNTKRSIL